MALIEVDCTELDVSGDVAGVLGRVAAAHDGIRSPDGALTAPSEWMIAADAATGEETHAQTLRRGFVRES